MWSNAVQANGNNPVGSIFVCRNSVVEEIGELHQLGAYPVATLFKVNSNRLVPEEKLACGRGEVKSYS